MVDPDFAFHPIFSTGSGLGPDEQVAVFELAGDGWMDYFVLLHRSRFVGFVRSEVWYVSDANFLPGYFVVRRPKGAPCINPFLKFIVIPFQQE